MWRDLQPFHSIPLHQVQVCSGVFLHLNKLSETAVTNLEKGFSSYVHHFINKFDFTLKVKLQSCQLYPIWASLSGIKD
jgi:hypothetical protein